MAFLNLEKMGRDFTLSGKEFHNFIVEGILIRSHLSKIYKTYILPILEYGCGLWDDCCIRDTQKLECLQLPTISQPMYLIYLYYNLIFFQFEVG
jgi:hypothetical protein